MLFTVVFPRWDEDGAARVQAWRSRHDPQAALLEPHFTLVFGAPVAQGAYLDHVAAVAAGTAPFRFVLTHAMPHPVPGRGTYVFLLPEQGAGALARLHRRLYGGPLASSLALDKPFVPHVTLGVCAEAPMALALADRWNAREPALHGEVRELTVGRRTEQGFGIVARLPLEGPAAA